ncbi:type II secretion system protein [Candidatus Uhrbacteria bacterium]|nr:type II secretion system protein [Candidatus Uhrbacteria bacterium]
MNSNTYDSKGFTLVEMVITIFLFSLLIVIVSDVFSRAQQAQRRTVALQRLQDDMRFFINKISSSIRSGSVTYAWYVQPQHEAVASDGNTLLALTTFDGKKVLVRRGADTNIPAPTLCNDADQGAPCMLLMSEDDGATWHRASSQDIHIDRLMFFIAPQKDPFPLEEQSDGSLDYGANAQPKVTVSVRASSRVSGLRGKAPSMTLQTTVSTREYKR